MLMLEPGTVLEVKQQLTLVYPPTYPGVSIEAAELFPKCGSYHIIVKLCPFLALCSMPWFQHSDPVA